MKKTGIIILTVLISLVFTAAAVQEQRPSKWAQPVKIDGVQNLFKVSDTLYRSEQPTAEGFKNLRKLGIKTVVNLRTFHTDSSLLKGSDLEYEHIYMKSWHAENEDAVKFLKIVTDPKKTPVLVHCQHGADRTGTMCAVYRMAVQGWSKEEALKEMTEGGFGFHEVWSNLPEWAGNLDVGKIRKEAGIPDRGK
ncbi:MAG TPA: dual specificity protein phosphatase family protein [Desulfomonilia bacterium]